MCCLIILLFCLFVYGLPFWVWFCDLFWFEYFYLLFEVVFVATDHCLLVVYCYVLLACVWSLFGFGFILLVLLDCLIVLWFLLVDNDLLLCCFVCFTFSCPIIMLATCDGLFLGWWVNYLIGGYDLFGWLFSDLILFVWFCFRLFGLVWYCCFEYLLLCLDLLFCLCY